MFDWDVVIVGGGPAGLTAGLYLSRGRYRTMLIEKERRLCQSILSGLPVEELEQRIILLEEQLKNSILIERE